MDISNATDLSGETKRNAFRDWAAKAKPGDKAVYHRGEYCAGFYKSQALEMAYGNLIDLVQVRLAPKQFAYVAVKRKSAK